MGKSNRIVLVGGNMASAALDTDVTLAGNSDAAVCTQKAAKTYMDALSLATVDTDDTLAADSDVIVASQKAIKAYVDTLIAALTLQVETIDSGEAVSNEIEKTLVDNTASGAGAITLAAPSATMLSKIKTITMSVDGGDVTLALTNVNNVAGASAGTTCTFDAVGDTLILAATGAKWTVIGISGAAIT